ncbi:MAG: insulinase family protein, partial [Ignavibacteriae bacterium]|nr:insulinase family protein [Ignavibacteriota bacterium]
TVMVLVKVGSRYEDPMHSGIAHFVEHMFFKGTEKRPTSKDIGMAIEKIGGSSNAFTGQDFTGYYIKVPKENFAVSIEILADMIKHGIFQQNEIDKERGVIIEEIRMYEDRPTAKASSVWYESFFGDTPLGRDIAGSIETVQNLQREDFINFVERNYVGSNMIVAVAGGINHKQVEELTKEYFNDIREGEPHEFEKYKINERKPKIVNYKKTLEQSHLVLGGYGIPRDYENKYTLEVANTILGKGFGSKLFQVIREEHGLAYYVYSGFSSLEELGLFKVGMGVENSKINLAVKAVMQEIKKIMKGDFDEDDMERAKNYLLGGLVTDMEETDDHALWYGMQQLLQGKFDTIEDVKTKIMEISKDDVVTEMSKILGKQSFLLAGVTPNKQIDNTLEADLQL